MYTTGGEDYQHVTSTVYFGPDLTPLSTVRISVLDDSASEGEERFTLQLTSFDASIILINSITEIVVQDNDGMTFVFLHYIVTL